MEQGFTKASSANLPRIDLIMLGTFLASNKDFCSAEFRNVKTSIIMPPSEPTLSTRIVPNGDHVAFEDKKTVAPVAPSSDKREWQLVWRNIIVFTLLHIGAIYGAYLYFFKVMWATSILYWPLAVSSGLGITAGVHRLWSHKSYKARWPLRLLLVFFNTIAFQDSVIDWARDHRMHHKYTETDADPHNATRGFFFSHVGWLLVRKHPDIKAKGHTIDMSDLYADPMLRFQKKYYLALVVGCCFIMPTLVPTLWGESLWNAFFVWVVLRYAHALNNTWLVNSAAHMWGEKPYDESINPVENKAVSFMVLGEGFHNYHHVFPWDYKTAELGNYSLNVTKLFIDLMAAIGWAYDMKTVPRSLVKSRVERTGDGTHALWGWGDRDITAQDVTVTSIIKPRKSSVNRGA